MGYADEDTAANVYLATRLVMCRSAPLDRLYSSGRRDYFLTTNEAESEDAIGYAGKGIACYALETRLDATSTGGST